MERFRRDAGQSIELGQTWSNKGILRLSDGTLKLRGSFTPADIGTIERTGGHAADYRQTQQCWNNV